MTSTRTPSCRRSVRSISWGFDRPPHAGHRRSNGTRYPAERRLVREWHHAECSCPARRRLRVRSYRSVLAAAGLLLHGPAGSQGPHPNSRARRGGFVPVRASLPSLTRSPGTRRRHHGRLPRATVDFGRARQLSPRYLTVRGRPQGGFSQSDPRRSRFVQSCKERAGLVHAMWVCGTKYPGRQSKG